MSAFLWLLGLTWAGGTFGVVIASTFGYIEAARDRKNWPTLYSEAQTGTRRQRNARRAFTAYLWPLWAAKWLASTYASMADTAFGPQDKS